VERQTIWAEQHVQKTSSMHPASEIRKDNILSWGSNLRFRSDGAFAQILIDPRVQDSAAMCKLDFLNFWKPITMASNLNLQKFNVTFRSVFIAHELYHKNNLRLEPLLFGPDP